VGVFHALLRFVPWGVTVKNIWRACS